MTSRAARPKSKSTRANVRRESASPPEVQISYAALGHETRSAIHEHLAESADHAARTADEAPEISLSEGPAGRETLALIADLARPIRPEQDTLRYGDRISNAPLAKTPSSAPKAPTTDSVESAQAELAVFELRSFVVRGADASRLASPALRQHFVEQRLLVHLPVRDMNSVEQIEVNNGSAPGTLIVRVWCKL